MILPTDTQKRHALYRNVIRECEISRSDRRYRARRMRQWFLSGSDSGAARHNKIKEHVQFSSSYLYAPDGVRFGVQLPPTYEDEKWAAELEIVKQETHSLWHDSPAALQFGVGVTWAHVWDSVIFKVIVSQNQPVLTMAADPSDIGVLNEALDDWDQEAIVHWYTMDIPRFARVLATSGLSRDRQAELLSTAETYAIPGYEANHDVLPPTMQRLILASASPTMVGTAQGAGEPPLALPRVADPVVRLAELWIKDDQANDYRVATVLLATEDVLWDPLNALIPQEHPFHALSLDTVPGYLWGLAPIEQLIALQLWYDSKINNLDDRENKEIDPPIFAKGFTQITDEQMKVFRIAGGNITSPMPNAEVTPVPPSPMADPFAMLNRIDQIFARSGALPQGMQGVAEAGVRSGDQAMTNAALAAGPTLNRAMRVERVMEDIATSMLKLRRRTAGVPMKTLAEAAGPGQEARAREFLLAQVPGDLIVKVWAHSQSPLFAKDLVQRAMIAKKEGAIDAADLLDYLALPGDLGKMKDKARKIAEAQAQTKERAIRIKETEAQAKKERASRG